MLGFLLWAVAWTVGGPCHAVAADKEPLTPQTVVEGGLQGEGTLEFPVGQVDRVFTDRMVMPGECEMLHVTPKATAVGGLQVYVTLSSEVSTRLVQLGITDPEEHFRGKVLRVSGVVERFRVDPDTTLGRIRRDIPGRNAAGKVQEYVIAVKSLDQIRVVRLP